MNIVVIIIIIVIIIVIIIIIIVIIINRAHATSFSCSDNAKGLGVFLQHACLLEHHIPRNVVHDLGSPFSTWWGGVPSFLGGRFRKARGWEGTLLWQGCARLRCRTEKPQTHAWYATGAWRS